jgi:hypothetical protein
MAAEITTSKPNGVIDRILIYACAAVIIMLIFYLSGSRFATYNRDKTIDKIYTDNSTIDYFKNNPAAICVFKSTFSGGNKSVDVYYCENQLTQIRHGNERLVVYTISDNNTIIDRKMEQDSYFSTDITLPTGLNTKK